MDILSRSHHFPSTTQLRSLSSTAFHSPLHHLGPNPTRGNGSSSGGGGRHHEKWLVTALAILAWDTCTYIFGGRVWDQIGHEESWWDDA